MLLMVTELVVLLVILKVFAALRVPTVPPVKARLVGAVVTGAWPVPVISTNASRLLLLSSMVAAPLMEPTWVGVNVMFAVQEPPPPIPPPHLSASAYSPLISI